MFAELKCIWNQKEQNEIERDESRMQGVAGLRGSLIGGDVVRVHRGPESALEKKGVQHNWGDTLYCMRFRASLKLSSGRSIQMLVDHW